MKKTILMMAAMLMMAGSLFAAQATKEFSRGLTTEVSVDGAFRVVMSEQYRNNVKIVYDEVLTNLITTEIKGKQLKISYERSANKMFKQSNVELPTIYIDRNFANYVFKGAVEATADEVIECPELSVRLADNSSLKAQISAGKFDVVMSGVAMLECKITAREASFSLAGSSSAVVKGSATKLAVGAQGSSAFKGEGLDNQAGAIISTSGSSVVTFDSKGSAKISAMGTSSVEGNVQCKALDVKSGGSSCVTLTGSSKTLKLSAMGASRFEPKEYRNEMTAKVNVGATANAIVESRGAMKITASGAATINVECPANIAVKASGTSTVLHSSDAKLTKLTLKDQATVRAVEEKAPLATLR